MILNEINNYYIGKQIFTLFTLLYLVTVNKKISLELFLPVFNNSPGGIGSTDLLTRFRDFGFKTSLPGTY